MYEELKARLDDAWTTTSPREHIEFMVSCREAIEQLEHQLEEARGNYLGAMTDCGNLERQLAERDAEIAEYLDAPVLWAKSEDIAQGKLKQQSVNAWHKQYDCDTKLIVKPGEGEWAKKEIQSQLRGVSG